MAADFSQYLSWEKVRAQNGAVYYKMPDSAYLYDPAASQLQNRPVLWSDPRADIAKSEAEKKQQLDAAKKAASPLSQLAPIGAAALAVPVAKSLANGEIPFAGLFEKAGNALSPIVDGVDTAATSLGNAAAVAPATPNVLAINGASPVVAEQGGLLGSGALSTGLGIAGTGLGAYEAFQGIRKHNPLQAGLGGAGIGLGLNTLGYSLGPLGWAAAAGIPVVASLFDHESTRDVARKHTSSLLDQGQDNPAWQNYVQGMRGQYDSAPADPSKPFHGGQFGSWDEYKAAGLDAGDLTGVYGNLKTFGPEWASLNLDQQKAVTQALIDNNLYSSKKGEVVVTDPEKAKQLSAQILGKAAAGSSTNPLLR